MVFLEVDKMFAEMASCQNDKLPESITKMHAKYNSISCL
jgi:hypothetical protein